MGRHAAPDQPAPGPQLPAVDPALNQAAWGHIGDINADPALGARASERDRVQLASIAMAPVVESAGGYSEHDGPAYTTDDINQKVGAAHAHTMQDVETGRAPTAGEQEQVAPVVSLADRVRVAQQSGVLQGHRGGQGLGSRIMQEHPVDMSDAAVRQRHAGREDWRRRRAELGQRDDAIGQ